MNVRLGKRRTIFSAFLNKAVDSAKGIFNMKKMFVGAFSAIFLFFAAAAGCAPFGPANNSSQSSSSGDSSDMPKVDTTKLAKVIPTVYDNDEVVTAAETEAGDVESWQAQVFTKNGGNNDEVTPNALIKSPWHTLTINNTSVPVYTARCGKGSHSFAWVDVATCKDDFNLEVTLTMDQAYKQCEILPQSKNTAAVIEGKTIKSVITQYGSFTYTFSTSASAKATDPTMAPLTIMVTEEEQLKVPLGYDVTEIEPGYHDNYELEFTETDMYYVFKAGLHEISSINIPENSVLYLERGAYLKCTDRKDSDGGQNTKTAIHAQNVDAPQIQGRGLLDMGEVKGGDGKYKHVVNMSRCTDAEIDGLTIINSNTWTMCVYNCDNAVMEHNLLLGYRTYSDGICMSECVDSVGRYNFVRTGDDAIEFKGHGWGGQRTGENCVYEYNDLWTDKGSGYCLTWESTCDMENMVFRNNAVGFAQPTWSSGNNALDVRLGTKATVRWGDVTFKNIEIYHVISPNVMITQVSGVGGLIDNILFENITVHSVEDSSVYAYTMSSGVQDMITNIKIKNYNFCGKNITSADKDNEQYIHFVGLVDKDQLTIV